MEKSLQRKVIFQKTFNTTLPFKAQCANIISNKNVKLFNKTFTHEIYKYLLIALKLEELISADNCFEVHFYAVSYIT